MMSPSTSSAGSARFQVSCLRVSVWMRELASRPALRSSSGGRRSCGSAAAVRWPHFGLISCAAPCAVFCAVQLQRGAKSQRTLVGGGGNASGTPSARFALCFACIRVASFEVAPRFCHFARMLSFAVFCAVSMRGAHCAGGSVCLRAACSGCSTLQPPCLASQVSAPISCLRPELTSSPCIRCVASCTMLTYVHFVLCS